MASASLTEMQPVLDIQRDEPDRHNNDQPTAYLKLTRAQRVIQREQEPAFDVAGFLELLGDSLRERLHDDEARTGVLTARIHISAGEPWAASVQFDDEEKRAA
jgi:hypothetical protein